MAECDVLIVGAGISGLTVGALLADAGRKVLVLEGAPTIGGRTPSTTYKGQPMECTPHYPSGA